MASLKEQLNQSFTTIAAMQREADDRTAEIASLKAQLAKCDINALNAAREDAHGLRKLLRMNNEDHAAQLLEKQQQLDIVTRLAKERGMRLQQLTNRSSVDRGQGRVVAHVDAKRSVAMQQAKDEAVATGKPVAVKS